MVYLDVLRAAAILLVASGHMLGAFAIPKDLPVFGRPIWMMMAQLAVAGVDMFYVLSGFLIGGLLLTELQREGGISIGRFYGRRALRLWPAYFLAVLFAWRWYRYVHPVVDGERMMAPSLRDMWPFFLQVQNYYDLHAHHKLNIGAVMQTWTMASLVHFYLLIPWLLLLLVKIGGDKATGRIRSLPWVVLGIFAACLYMRWRARPINADAYDAWKNYFPTHLRLDELMAGVLAAYWVLHARPQVNRVMRHWPVVLIVSLLALLPVAIRKEEGPPFLVIWGYTLGGLGCLGLVMVGWWFSQPRVDGSIHRASWPVVCFAQVGVWSYSIYLWHQPMAQFVAPKVRARMFDWMVRRHMDPWHSQFQYLMSAVIYFSIALAIGAIMYYVVEKPSLWLRERLISRSHLRPVAPNDPSCRI
jgi:peptidoglycan/LPS O-acetylase OafA/YrhL